MGVVLKIYVNVDAAQDSLGVCVCEKKTDLRLLDGKGALSGMA
jgi:hypothetical protein